MLTGGARDYGGGPVTNPNLGGPTNVGGDPIPLFRHEGGEEDDEEDDGTGGTAQRRPKWLEPEGWDFPNQPSPYRGINYRQNFAPWNADYQGLNRGRIPPDGGVVTQGPTPGGYSGYGGGGYSNFQPQPRQMQSFGGGGGAPGGK